MPQNSGKNTKRRKGASANATAPKTQKKTIGSELAQTATLDPGLLLDSLLPPAPTRSTHISGLSTGPSGTHPIGIVSSSSDFPAVNHSNFGWNLPTGWSLYAGSMQTPQHAGLNASQFANPFPHHSTLPSSPSTLTIPPHGIQGPIQPMAAPSQQQGVSSEDQAVTLEAATLEDNRARSRSQSTSSLDSEDNRPPRSQQTSIKRIRISRRNPTFGFVEGAMVGNKEFSIPRKRKLRDLQEEVASANRRFKRELEDIISRAERLSIETECWLLLCVQLPGSTPIYHYTSQRFRREALDDASAMVTAFQNATYSLNLAKRKEAKEITEKYEKQLSNERQLKKVAEGQAAAARKNQESAEAEVAMSRQRELSLQAELAGQRAIVEAYRMQLTSQMANLDQGPRVLIQ